MSGKHPPNGEIYEAFIRGAGQWFAANGFKTAIDRADFSDRAAAIAATLSSWGARRCGGHEDDVAKKIEITRASLNKDLERPSAEMTAEQLRINLELAWTNIDRLYAEIGAEGDELRRVRLQFLGEHTGHSLPSQWRC